MEGLLIAADITPVPLPTLKPAGEAIVYHTTNGKSYHMASTCSNVMSGGKPFTLAECVADGYGPCGICFPPAKDLLEAENVVWCDADKVFHTSDQCEKFSGQWKLMTAEDAMAQGYVGCMVCGTTAFEVAAAQHTPDNSWFTEAEDDLVDPDSVIVYYNPGSKYYHKEQTCRNMPSSSPHTLAEALRDGKLRCPTCNPPE